MGRYAEDINRAAEAQTKRAPPGACPDDARPIVQLLSKQEEGGTANHKHFRIERHSLRENRSAPLLPVGR